MDNFTFNISLSVLNHLGRNLYRNFITVLGEAISNSWDADAKNVFIYIDRESNYLIIKDDGDGMTSDDFQNKFLKIGYSKRKDGTDKTTLNRPFIGRKGIGKLALLSCAKRIHVLTKTKDTDFVGGVIDNSSLTDAIKDDLNPQEYQLGSANHSIFGNHLKDIEKGTIVYFEDIHEGIRNRIEYIRKLVALYFRFSIIDNSFRIYLDDAQITVSDLEDLSKSTQFVWQINTLDDQFLLSKLSGTNEHIREYKYLDSELPIKGFIASVEKPSQLRIRDTKETVSIDLYVNGRLREKDLLRHIPTARVVENYLYGQIHYDDLDSGADRFTSSREGIISDDPLFKDFLEELSDKLKTIILDWDLFRDKINQDGDPDNMRKPKKERKAKELFNTVADEFTNAKSSSPRNLVDNWVYVLGNDAEFNFSAYADCFVSENLLRKYIRHKSIPLSEKATEDGVEWRKREERNKNLANISFDIRQSNDDLTYLDMWSLASAIERNPDFIKDANLPRDAREYKPIRDAMAHTALLTPVAKDKLHVTYENLKARIKKILDENGKVN